MKKFILASISFFISMYSFAQEPSDALRYSWYVPGSSARIQAVGGANGSLGGDISAAFINPAGLAFYRTGDFVFTPIYSFGKANATYLGRAEQQQQNKFTWGTTGFVWGAGSGGRKVKNITFSLAMNRTADFNSNILYRGQNNFSSFSQKFAEELNNAGVKDSTLAENNYPLGASLLYNTHWIDYVKNTSGQIDHFATTAPIGTGLNQQQTINSTGGITEFTFGAAANVKDKILFGASLGVPVLSYNRTTEFLEGDATTNANNHFDYGIFSDILHTSGVGINVKAGVIYKPAESWRVGLSVHSPTFYSLTDNYEADVVLNDDVPDNLAWHDNSKNYTGGKPSDFKYQLITPYKIIASASYVLHEVQDVRQQKGFLTADIEYTNYAASSFQPDADNNNDQATKDYLKQLNTAISNSYKGAINFRVGGELKFTTLMVRAGAAYYSNPYQTSYGANGNRLNLSGGLGYRNKGFFIDLTYVYSTTKDVNFAYRLQNSPYFGANIKDNRSNVLLTFGFKI